MAPVQVKTALRPKILWTMIWKRRDWSRKMQSPLPKIEPTGGLSLPKVAERAGGTRSGTARRTLDRVPTFQNHLPKLSHSIGMRHWSLARWRHSQLLAVTCLNFVIVTENHLRWTPYLSKRLVTFTSFVYTSTDLNDRCIPTVNSSFGFAWKHLHRCPHFLKVVQLLQSINWTTVKFTIRLTWHAPNCKPIYMIIGYAMLFTVDTIRDAILTCDPKADVSQLNLRTTARNQQLKSGNKRNYRVKTDMPRSIGNSQRNPMSQSYSL